MGERTAFGVERVSCSCRHCRRNCMYMPGHLLPEDLGRMVPPDADPFLWAETNLLASPGAIAVKNGELFRIPTLVPAKKPDGSCIHYRRRKCQIWENAPFGCAFFGCGAADEDRLSGLGAKTLCIAMADGESLYYRIWRHLWDAGRRQEPVEDIRARMRETE